MGAEGENKALGWFRQEAIAPVWSFRWISRKIREKNVCRLQIPILIEDRLSYIMQTSTKKDGGQIPEGTFYKEMNENLEWKTLKKNFNDRTIW